jgi:hypothetical protein
MVNLITPEEDLTSPSRLSASRWILHTFWGLGEPPHLQVVPPHHRAEPPNLQGEPPHRDRSFHTSRGSLHVEWRGPRNPRGATLAPWVASPSRKVSSPPREPPQRQRGLHSSKGSLFAAKPALHRASLLRYKQMYEYESVTDRNGLNTHFSLEILISILTIVFTKRCSCLRGTNKV